MHFFRNCQDILSSWWGKNYLALPEYNLQLADWTRFSWILHENVYFFVKNLVLVIGIKQVVLLLNFSATVSITVRHFSRKAAVSQVCGGCSLRSHRIFCIVYCRPTFEKIPVYCSVIISLAYTFCEPTKNESLDKTLARNLHLPLTYLYCLKMDIRDFFVFPPGS